MGSRTPHSTQVTNLSSCHEQNPTLPGCSTSLYRLVYRGLFSHISNPVCCGYDSSIVCRITSSHTALWRSLEGTGRSVDSGKAVLQKGRVIRSLLLWVCAEHVIIVMSTNNPVGQAGQAPCHRSRALPQVAGENITQSVEGCRHGQPVQFEGSLWADTRTLCTVSMLHQLDATRKKVWYALSKGNLEVRTGFNWLRYGW